MVGWLNIIPNETQCWFIGFATFEEFLHRFSHSLSLFASFFTTFICIITNDSLSTETIENNKRWNQVFRCDGGFTFFLEWNRKFPIEAMQVRLIQWNWLWSSLTSFSGCTIVFVQVWFQIHFTPRSLRGSLGLEIRITFVAITFGWACVSARPTVKKQIKRLKDADKANEITIIH